MTICPGLTSRIPAMPSKGAWISFLSMTDCMLSTAAFFCVYFDEAASSSAFEITLRFARSRARSKSALASSASACAERTVRLLGRRVQLQQDIALLHRPARLEIDLAHGPGKFRADQSRLAPARSNRRRSSIGCQSACFTFALVTVVGGGTIFFPAEIIVKICRTLIPAMTRETADEAEHDPEDGPFWLRFGADEAELAAVGREGSLVVAVCMGSSTEEKSPECAGDV